MKLENKDIFKEGEKLIGSKISVNGWVRTARSSGSFGFIELNDGTFFKNLQIVFDDKLSNFKDIEKVKIGSAISVDGEMVKSPAKEQAFELKAEKIEIVADSEESYPLQKKRHTFEYLRTIAHLRPRSNTFSAVFRVRSLAAFAIHKFFNEKGFVYVHTPIITGSDAEGAGEMFHVTTQDLKNPIKTDKGEIDYTKDFFGKETNLTVSGQLEGETFAMAFNKIYTFGPTFRAENSNTKRHAAEFWMVEPEIAFAGLKEDADLAEEMIKYIIKYVIDNAPEEMNFFNKFIDTALMERLQNVLNSSFERVSYTDAVKLLENLPAEEKSKFEYPVGWGKELQTEHERYLTEKIFNKPVFVTDYPKDFKAFYMRQNDDGKTVAAMDLLVPGIGEIIGGSQREERYDRLTARIKELGLHEEDYSWYLDLRKFGGAKHAGFGLGFERMIMYLTGMENIRDVIPFPRTPGNADF
ncbi:MAG: Asparagine-tRNA ligase [Parcubacteria group bacterium GW2011_GWF2_38_76]|nr:MAG: Asparagine-tRNA ligase [Parcubacteria group bacterium GW2011_GWF2_38_76]HBM45955.1 asparagine--tRNA ligase [Patescibacteria group bacterium]